MLVATCEHHYDPRWDGPRRASEAPSDGNEVLDGVELALVPWAVEAELEEDYCGEGPAKQFHPVGSWPTHSGP